MYININIYTYILYDCPLISDSQAFNLSESRKTIHSFFVGWCFSIAWSDFWEINKFSNFPWLPTHQTKLVLSNWIMFKQPKISGQIFPQILTEVSRFTTSCTVTKEQLKQTARWEFFPKVPDTIHSIFLRKLSWDSCFSEHLWIGDATWKVIPKNNSCYLTL